MEWFIYKRFGVPMSIKKDEKNEIIAKNEADDGRYDVYNDNIPEEERRTLDERFVDLEEALTMILEGVVE